MDEAKIAAEVAKNIPQDEPPKPPEPTPEVKPEPSAFETNIELNDPAISLQLADYFGLSRVDRLTEERQSQLRNIYRWASKKAGSTDLNDVMMSILTLDRELGSTYKPDRLNIISRWVKLNQQAEAVQKEMEFLRG